MYRYTSKYLLIQDICIVIFFFKIIDFKIIFIFLLFLVIIKSPVSEFNVKENIKYMNINSIYLIRFRQYIVWIKIIYQW